MKDTLRLSDLAYGQPAPKLTPKPEAVPPSFKVGDRVWFKGATHYVSSYPGSKGYNNVKNMPGWAKITIINQKLLNTPGAHPYHLVYENWADLKGIKPQPMPDGQIILEYAGNIGRVQGLDKVIDNLPDKVELHLYGTGSMEEEIMKMNHPRVFFHGPYFRSQQNEVLAACHMAIVTLQEGMYGLGVPSKTYNILASGRPVLYFGPKDSEIDLLVKENQE